MQRRGVPVSEAALHLGEKVVGTGRRERHALPERVDARAVEQGLGLFEAIEAQESEPEDEMWALEVWDPCVACPVSANAGQRSLESAGSRLSDADLHVHEIDQGEQRQLLVCGPPSSLLRRPAVAERRACLGLQGV